MKPESQEVSANPDPATQLYWAIASAKISKIVPRIPDPGASPVKGAILSRVLPSVHLLAVVAVLDDALSIIVERSDSASRAANRNLASRIDFVAAQNTGVDGERLHEVRRLRNGAAHLSDVAARAEVTWDVLDSVVAAIVDAMIAMKLLPAQPEIEARYERTPTFFPDDVGPNGERLRQTFRVWAELAGETILAYTHELSYFPPDADVAEQ